MSAFVGVYSIVLKAVGEENDMGETCDTYDSEQKCIQHFVGKGKRPLRNPWLNGRNILKCVIKETGVGTVWSGLIRLTKWTSDRLT
jgi:hypothetical protein